MVGWFWFFLPVYLVLKAKIPKRNLSLLSASKLVFPVCSFSPQLAGRDSPIRAEMPGNLQHYGRSVLLYYHHLLLLHPRAKHLGGVCVF